MTASYTSRLLSIAAAALTFVAFPHLGLASGPGEAGKKAEAAAEGKTSHFEIAVPSTKEDAAKLLKVSLAKIEVGLSEGKFEEIHEATYSVEAALDRLAQEPGYDGLKTTVSPRLEIVHLASEQGDGDTLKAAVPSLMKAARGNLQALLN
jgi:hypothetical protein